MSIKDKYHVERISFNDCKDWLLYKHYAHRIPSISYAFGLFDTDNILQGVCTFGRTAFQEASFLCGEEKKNLVYELNRLIVNQFDKNMTSFFVSQCLRLLPKPSIIISYSDEGQGHFGYIYQACNFLYSGCGIGAINYITSIGKLSRSGMRNRETRNQEIPEIYRIENGTRKHRYIYFIGTKKEKKEMLKALKYEIQPYPKGENKNYDASYEPTVQGRLF